MFCPVLLIGNHVISLKCLALCPCTLTALFSIWPTEDNTNLTNWVGSCVSQDRLQVLPPWVSQMLKGITVSFAERHISYLLLTRHVFQENVVPRHNGDTVLACMESPLHSGSYGKDGTCSSYVTWQFSTGVLMYYPLSSLGCFPGINQGPGQGLHTADFREGGMETLQLGCSS